MSTNWHNAKLFDFAGKELGHVRVPAKPMPPGVIRWSGRYFMLTLPNGEYSETQCYETPVERIYPAMPQGPGVPFRKPER